MLTLSPESPASKHRYFLPVSQFLKPVTRVSNPRCGILGTAHLTCHAQVRGCGIFIVYSPTHVVRLYMGHVLIEYWRSQPCVTGLWLAPCNPTALSISAVSPRLCTGLSRTDSGLHVLLSGKTAYPQRGWSLLPSSNNSNRSPENWVLCEPEVTGCSQNNKQGDYHCSRRAVLMASALARHDSWWHGTRHFHSYLLAKDTCRMTDGSDLCELMLPWAHCYGIICSQYYVIGYSHNMLSNKCCFRSGEPWFSIDFIYLEHWHVSKSKDKKPYKFMPFLELKMCIKGGMYYKQILSPSYISAGAVWHYTKQLKRGSKDYCMSQKCIQLCCGVLAARGTKGHLYKNQLFRALKLLSGWQVKHHICPMCPKTLGSIEEKSMW